MPRCALVFRLAAACVGAAPAAFALTVEAAAQVPPPIAAPGQVVVAQFHAVGAQIYECKADSSGTLSLQFREPIATLIADGKTVGRHYAGPTWELSDGGAVIGKAAASAPGATSHDVAWLRLDVVSRRGGGALENVATVQRINTSGGMLAGPCDKAGVLTAVPYAADYVFLRPN